MEWYLNKCINKMKDQDMEEENYQWKGQSMRLRQLWLIGGFAQMPRWLDGQKGQVEWEKRGVKGRVYGAHRSLEGIWILFQVWWEAMGMSLGLHDTV